MAKKKMNVIPPFKCYTICLGKSQITESGITYLPFPDPADGLDSIAHHMVLKGDKAKGADVDRWVAGMLKQCCQSEGYLCEVTIKPIRLYKTVTEIKDLVELDDL